SVTGYLQIGGLIGKNDPGTVSNCFWDTETSGQSSSAGGTGKTNSDMQDYNTFTDENTSGLTSAWDFVTDPNDDSGTNDYWDMDQKGTVNDYYPILSWQDGADGLLEPPYSGGIGTSDDPYQIATTDDLIELSNTSGDWDKYFIQTADIAFNADKPQVDLEGDGSAGGSGKSGFSPIGNYTTTFTGSYNGQEHSITGLTIDRSSDSNIGMFGYNSGTIDNVHLYDIDVNGATKVGGLVGENNDGSVSNCSSSGNVNGDWCGGLVGWNNDGTVSNSSSSGSVNGNDELGGLVGRSTDGGTVSNSGSSSVVTGENAVGGLLGYNEGPTSNSNSSGNVTGDFGVGGLVGVNLGSVSNCYSTGAVSRNNDSTAETFGAFCGMNGYEEPGKQSFPGGHVSYCYATGDVVYGNATNPTDKGFVGYDYNADYTANFFDSEASNQNSDTAGAATAKSTAEMQNSETFSDSDWTIGERDDIEKGYPFLAWEIDENGEKNPVWLIGTGNPAAVPLSNMALFLGMLLISGFVFLKVYRIN
ncbi:MAG: GLUG motif-containing protein, partial [Bacteroidales bacterium]